MQRNFANDSRQNPFFRLGSDEHDTGDAPGHPPFARRGRRAPAQRRGLDHTQEAAESRKGERRPTEPAQRVALQSKDVSTCTMHLLLALRVIAYRWRARAEIATSLILIRWRVQRAGLFGLWNNGVEFFIWSPRDVMAFRWKKMYFYLKTRITFAYMIKFCFYAVLNRNEMNYVLSVFTNEREN